MTALVRSELIKLRTVRMPAWLLAMAVALVVMLVFVTVPSGPGSDGELSLQDADVLARVVGVAASGSQVVLLVLGILAYTQELRFGTVTATFLVAPDRRRVLAAKGLALMLAGLVFAAVLLALAIVLGFVLIHVRGGTLSWSAGFWPVLAGAVVAMALYGPIGVCVGALVHHQIAALVGTLLWLLVVEQFLIALVPAVGRWTFGGATAGLLQLGRAATTHGTLLGAWSGGLLLGAYGATFAALAVLVGLRRDLA
jgi:ABC-2 type transport system permease protein